MKTDRPSLLTGLRALLACIGLLGAAASTGCTTTDPAADPDTAIYPTAAERNLEMQDQMDAGGRSPM